MSMEASSFNDCEKDEENSHHNNNNIVNLFSQVLMKRYKFALTDLILSMHAILKLIEEAHQIFLKTIPNVYQISSSQQKTCLKKKKDSLNEVLELFFRKFVLIQEHVPRFLGEEEIVLFAKTLEENIKFPEMELFWDLKLDTNGREIAKKMSSLIQKLQIHIYPSFQQALEKNMTNCIRLTKKKEYLSHFVKESVEILANNYTKKIADLEVMKVKLMEEYRTALAVQPLLDEHRIEYQIEAIEASMLGMLSVHLDICHTINRANAQVKQGILKKEERLSVDDFVQVLMEIKAKTLNFQTALQDPNAFMKRIQLFEKAAQKDAFVVCSSALKLQFTHFLDEELFLAYVQDWKIHHKSLQTLHTSLIYTKANKQAQDLKLEIAKTQLQIETNAKKVVLDEPAQRKLCKQIDYIFQEEGAQIDSFPYLFPNETLS